MCVRVLRSLMDTELWPEFAEMNKVLTQHLSEVADQIIADAIDPDRSDAEALAALPPPATGSDREA